MQPDTEVQAKIDYLVPSSRVNRHFWAPGRELDTGLYAPYEVTVLALCEGGSVRDEEGTSRPDCRPRRSIEYRGVAYFSAR
jgi:hypothetical protein